MNQPRVLSVDHGDSFLVTGTTDVEAARHAIFQYLIGVGDHTPDEAADRIYRLQPSPHTPGSAVYLQ